MINVCYIVRCGLNEALGIFQLSFIAESGEKFCAKRFFNLSRMIFRFQPNDFSFLAERNEAWLKDA